MIEGARLAILGTATATEGGGCMDDNQLHQQIEQLVAEEHELWKDESEGRSNDADARRLEQVRVMLDQCWDLLRQRRALREAHLDPDGAHGRPPEVVERYEQ
jgi:hypothetical protein